MRKKIAIMFSLLCLVVLSFYFLTTDIERYVSRVSNADNAIESSTDNSFHGFETPCVFAQQTLSFNTTNNQQQFRTARRIASNIFYKYRQRNINNFVTVNADRFNTALLHKTFSGTNFPAPYRFSENHIYSNCNLRL